MLLSALVERFGVSCMRFFWSLFDTHFTPNTVYLALCLLLTLTQHIRFVYVFDIFLDAESLAYGLG